jgi:hypothetical protein
MEQAKSGYMTGPPLINMLIIMIPQIKLRNDFMELPQPNDGCGIFRKFCHSSLGCGTVVSTLVDFFFI